MLLLAERLFTNFFATSVVILIEGVGLMLVLGTGVFGLYTTLPLSPLTNTPGGLGFTLL